MRREVGPGDDVLHAKASAVGGRVDVREASQLGGLGIHLYMVTILV